MSKKYINSRNQTFKQKKETFRNAIINWNKLTYRSYERQESSIIARMLYKDNKLLNTHFDNYYTPLCLATSLNNDECVKLLLDAGAHLDMAINGNTALMFSAKLGHEACMEVLLDAGADINKINKDGWTPLMFAASYGHDGCVALLLDAGADINKVDKNDWTPLMIATRYGHYECVKLLLDAGVDKNDGTPLMIATRYGHDECVKLLLDAGIVTNKVINNAINDAINNGRRPLMDAINNGNNIIARMIINHIIFNSAKHTILVAEVKNMNQDEAFLVYKKIVKGSIIDAGGSFDISPEIDSKLCKYFEKFMKSINDIRNTILFNSAKHTILVAEVNDMNQNEAFLVFKKILKGSGGFDINNPEIHFKLYKYFEKFMKSINHIRKQE